MLITGKEMKHWSIAAWSVLLLVALAAVACGGEGGGATSLASTGPPAFDARAALDEVAGAEPAAGIDAAVWDELTAELERSITARGTAAAPPAGTRVDDLRVTINLDGLPEFDWTYWNAGDYDLNGMVSASDLTPVGIYFGITEDDEEWPQAVVADGDRNGLIGLGDISVIGQHYGTYFTDYVLEQADTDDEAAIWTEVAVFPLDAMEIPAEGGLPVFEYDPDPSPGPAYYCVVPVHTESGLRYTPSNTAQLYGEVWNVPGQSTDQHYSSPFAGPQEDHTLQVYDSDWSVSWVEPLIGACGDIYFNSGGVFHALNRNGDIRWTYDPIGATGMDIFVDPVTNLITINSYYYTEEFTPGGDLVTHLPIKFDSLNLTTRPLIGPDGRMYGQVSDTEFGCIADNAVVWSVEQPEGCVPTQIMFGTGRVFVISDWPGAIGYTGVLVYTLDGEPLWSKTFGYGTALSIIAADDGYLFMNVSNFNSPPHPSALVALDPDGEELWRTEDEFDRIQEPAVTLDNDGRIFWGPVDNLLRCVDSSGNVQFTVELPLLAPDNRELPVTTDVDGYSYAVYKSEPFQTSTLETNACVVCIKPDGDVHWVQPIPQAEEVTSPLSIGTDGIGYLFTSDGLLVMIGGS